MTFKERWQKEHPNAVFDYYMGCPWKHGYEKKELAVDENESCLHKDISCKQCWDREIPEEKPVFEYQGEPIAKVKDIVEENGGITVHAEPIIKDSGDRTQFESGAVRDMREGKGRMDLLPWSAIMEVSKHCENGAKKYGEHNVDKGIPTSSLCDSAARHLAKYLEGWTDEPHLVAAAWNLLWAIQMEIKNPEVVNTPWNLRDGITDMKPE